MLWRRSERGEKTSQVEKLVCKESKMTPVTPNLMLRAWIRDNSKVAKVASELGVSRQAVHGWIKPDGSMPDSSHRIKLEEITGIPSGLWAVEDLRRAVAIAHAMGNAT